MTNVSTHQAKTHLSQLLAAVEKGDEIVISRRNRPVAKLVPYTTRNSRKRPKVGKMTGKRFPIPDSAFAPLTKEELLVWGL